MNNEVGPTVSMLVTVNYQNYYLIYTDAKEEERTRKKKREEHKVNGKERKKIRESTRRVSKRR